MDSAGEMQQTSVYARFKERSGRSSKRPLEDATKAALSESSAASISATFEFTMRPVTPFHPI